MLYNAENTRLFFFEVQCFSLFLLSKLSKTTCQLHQLHSNIRMHENAWNEYEFSVRKWVNSTNLLATNWHLQISWKISCNAYITRMTSHWQLDATIFWWFNFSSFGRILKSQSIRQSICRFTAVSFSMDFSASISTTPHGFDRHSKFLISANPFSLKSSFILRTCSIQRENVHNFPGFRFRDFQQLLSHTRTNR